MFKFCWQCFITSFTETELTKDGNASYLHLFILTWRLLFCFFLTISLTLLLLVGLHLVLQRSNTFSLKKSHVFVSNSNTYTNPLVAQHTDKSHLFRCSTSPSLSLVCSVSMGSSVSSDFCTSTREALDTLKIPWMFTRTLTFTLELSPDACGTTFWIRNWPVGKKQKTPSRPLLVSNLSFMSSINLGIFGRNCYNEYWTCTMHYGIPVSFCVHWILRLAIMC